MESNNTNPQPNQYQVKQSVPNSSAVLVLGILSIVSCWLYGLPGLAMGIIAIILGNSGEKAYNSNQDLYYEASYKNLKAGKICGIIGVSLSGLYLLIIIVAFAFLGFGLFSVAHIFDALK